MPDRLTGRSGVHASGANVARPRRPAVALSAACGAAAALAWAGSPARGQTATSFVFTGAQSNLWNDPLIPAGGGAPVTQPNWNPSTVPPAPPNDPTAAVMIPQPLAVQVNGTFTIGSLNVAAGAGVMLQSAGQALSIAPGAFTGSGQVTNAGVITIGTGATFGNAPMTGMSGPTPGDVMLSGGGSVMLGGGALAPASAGYAGRFFNVDNTIAGSGAIGAIAAGANRLAFNNAGTVNANVPFDPTTNGGAGNALSILIDAADAAPTTNTGTLEASGGGLLTIGAGTLANASADGTKLGTILAQDLSTVQLSAHVSGGTLATNGSGVIQPAAATLSNLSSLGHLQILAGTTTTLDGTIANAGLITLEGNATGGNAALNASTNGATLAGGGTLTLGNFAGNAIGGPGSLVNQNNTIQGSGSIAPAGGFTNQGTVNANDTFAAGVPNALTIGAAATTNAGTIQASNGGHLVLASPAATNSGNLQATSAGVLSIGTGSVVNNTGGTISAADQSVVQVAGAVSGGTLATSGTGVIQPAGGALSNLTSLGHVQVVAGASATLGGTIINKGLLTLEGSSTGGNATLNASVGGATLAGGGTLTLGNFAGNAIAGPGLLVNQDNLVQGAGTIGPTGGLANHGIVNANDAFNNTTPNALTLSVGGINTGTLEATGGGNLTLAAGSIVNTGGTVSAANGSAVHVAATLSGGTLATSGTGVIQPAGGTLSNLASLGHLQIVAGAPAATIDGTIQNKGMITVEGTNTVPAMLNVSAAGATLAGGGTLTLSAFNSNMLGGTGALTNQDNTIQGAGAIAPAGGFVNHAVVNANAAFDVFSNNPLTIAAPVVTNDATIQASNGGRVFFAPIAINNAGGTIAALDGSSVVLGANGGSVTGGTLTTSGSGTITGFQTTLNNLTNAGTYRVAVASKTTLNGTIDNAGTIGFAGTGTLQVNSDLTLAGGGAVALLNDTFQSTAGGGLFSIINQDNLVHGSGLIRGTLVNHAQVSADVPYVAATDNALNLTPIVGALPSANDGTLQASGGGMLRLLRLTLNNANGTVLALNGSTVQIVDSSLSGGTIASAGTGFVQLANNAGSTLANLTLGGGVDIHTGTTTLQGTITNAAAITIEPNANLDVAGGSSGATLPTATLAGGGSVTLVAGGAIGRAGPAGQSLLNASNTIAGAGELGAFSGMRFANSGIVQATDPTSPLVVDPGAGASVVNNSAGIFRASGAGGLNLRDGAYTNNGTFDVDNGSTLSVGSGSGVALLNYSAATQTLAGGTYKVLSTGSATTLDLGTRLIATNAANIVLSGANAAFPQISGMTANTGSLQLLKGRALTTAADLSNAGSITIDTGASLATNQLSGGAGTISVGPTSTGTLAARSVSQSALSIGARGTVTLSTNTPPTISTLNQLSITTGGKLDLANNQLLIHYTGGNDPDVAIRALITTGYNGGKWTGTGITSSAAAANPARFAVGYADQAASSTENVRFTIAGDATLDGTVNVVDLGVLATNFGKTSGATWSQGDFNYDGKVNVVDLGILATNFGAGTGLSPADAHAAFMADLQQFPQLDAVAALVPEPAGLSAFGLAAALGWRRRRRGPAIAQANHCQGGAPCGR